MEKKPRKKEINNIKVKKANIVNNDLKLNVDEQQDDIKHLKKTFKRRGFVYDIYPSIARTKKWLKKYIQETITKKSTCEIILDKC